MKYELRNVIKGKIKVRHGAAIQAATSFLRGSEKTSDLVKKQKHYKKQEAEVLKEFITQHSQFE